MARMKGQTIRFGRRQWALIGYASDREDVSTSQFVRNLASFGAVWMLAVEAKRLGCSDLHDELSRLDLPIAKAFEAVMGAPLPEEPEDPDLEATDGHAGAAGAAVDGHRPDGKVPFPAGD